MYELLFSSQQPKAKRLQKALLQCVVSSCSTAAYKQNEEVPQQAIEEKDAALALLTDDLQDRDNQIQAIQYENVALQAQRDVYQAQLQRCQDTIIHLRMHYIPHARDLGKDNIIIIVLKHTTPANDKYHELPYYVARIQQHKRYVKLRWFDRQFSDHEVIVEIQQEDH